jgi:Fe-S cluster assembly scaffold protein SufB
MERIRELNRWYDEFDRRFPGWYQRIRLEARRRYEEKEMAGDPICKYGKDFEFTGYVPNILPEHEKLKNLMELDDSSKQYVQTVGMVPEEKERAGSHLQEDTTVTYTPGGEGDVVAMNPDLAILQYPWLEKFVHRLVPTGLDKYTSLCTAYSIGGVFLWVKEGVSVNVPIQACFLMELEKLAQLPYIAIIIEPYAKVNIISGCVMNPGCTMGVHGCVTEMYIGKGAEVTFNIIHNFKPGFHVRPKVGVMVEEDASYVENYIEIGSPSSSQLYPTVILRGDNSRASMRSMFFGKGTSDMDIGSSIVFTGSNTRGEIVSRSVILDEATLKSLSSDASLTHEAAVGKIAEDQLYYLMSRKLSKDEAVSTIVRGFLDLEIPGLPVALQTLINKLLSDTAREVM